MRGDNALDQMAYCRFLGSPPHAWGQRASRAHKRGFVQVHPHMRGDNAPKKAFSVSVSGSPPHAWGQLGALKRKMFCPGSPPHAWGQPVTINKNTGRVRFTPTCVGTTTTSFFATNRSTGSPPHAWGQLDDRISQNIFLLGSPPHAWGQLIATGDNCTAIRFTPTCVGTTEVWL